MKTLLLCAQLATLAVTARPDAEDGAAQKAYDLAVIEATPGGIAMAVRAAREGLDVLLVNHNSHLGGILSSGLGVWDTLHEGKRAPIYDEVRQAMFAVYRDRYGEQSEQYRNALPGKSGHTNGRFEPHVAERVLSALVAREARITVLKGYVPVAAVREGASLRAVTLRACGGEQTVRVTAQAFADCTYEGDLLPLAKVAYRVGREARDEFGEPHAGKVFMQPTDQRPALISERDDQAYKRLKLRKFSGYQEIVPGASSGAGDRNVQAFNYRTVLTSDPANRLPVEKPANYDPEALKPLDYGSVVAPLPNSKVGWNRPQLVGPHQPYVEGDWAARARAMDEHWQATLALLWFLQHDGSVPEKTRAHWLPYGLAKDEFADNGHRPYELYVREARRLVGRHILTERDSMLVAGTMRAPACADSIAVSEWYLDAHACTTNRVTGSLHEGKMMLWAETWPGQVPYRALLPQGLDNLLVPVCLSATHVAWGGLRLEPTWMQIGEAAGLAVALAKRDGVAPAALASDKLVRDLCRRRSMVAFFNDVDVGAREPWVPAVLYFGTQGFFADYDARPGEPLSLAVRTVWAGAFDRLRDGTLDPRRTAVEVSAAETKGGAYTDETRGAFLAGLWERLR